MTDQQLAVLLYHIAQQIRIEGYVVLNHMPEDQRVEHTRGLFSLADQLFAQADALRGTYMSPNL